MSVREHFRYFEKLQVTSIALKPPSSSPSYSKLFFPIHITLPKNPKPYNHIPPLTNSTPLHNPPIQSYPPPQCPLQSVMSAPTPQPPSTSPPSLAPSKISFPATLLPTLIVFALRKQCQRRRRRGSSVMGRLVGRRMC